MIEKAHIGGKNLRIVAILSFLLAEAVLFFSKKNAKSMFSHPRLHLRRNTTIER